MKYTLIEESNKIGEIELELKPVKGDKLKYNDDTYTVLSIVHSESGIEILVRSNKNPIIETNWS